MKRLSKNYFLLVLLIVIAAGIVFVSTKNKCVRLSCLEMNGLSQFQLKEIYEDNARTYRALLSKNDNLLRVEVRYNIPPESANQSLQAEVTRMKALFENTLSPYPGMLSDEIECDKKFKPLYQTENINGIKVYNFNGFLNDRLVFGACTENQAVFKSNLNLFYCQNQRQVFTLELITPNNKSKGSDDLFQSIYSIRCKHQK